MSVPRSLLLSAIVTITVVVGAFFPGGVPFWWSVAIALPVGAAVMIACLLAGVFDVDWTPEPEQPAAGVCMQASTLADRLAGAADDQRRFATRIQPRLRRLALDRLRRKEGIDDLADPMARDLLGADLHDLITTSDGRLPPPKIFVAMVRRLEEP